MTLSQQPFPTDEGPEKGLPPVDPSATALPLAPAPWLLTCQTPGLLLRLLLGGPLAMVGG